MLINLNDTGTLITFEIIGDFSDVTQEYVSSASGDNSFTTGEMTIASGKNSIAGGKNTFAIGENSLALGENFGNYNSVSYIDKVINPLREISSLTTPEDVDKFAKEALLVEILEIYDPNNVNEQNYYNNIEIQINALYNSKPILIPLAFNTWEDQYTYFEVENFWTNDNVIFNVAYLKKNTATGVFSILPTPYLPENISPDDNNWVEITDGFGNIYPTFVAGEPVYLFLSNISGRDISNATIRLSYQID